jgi:hypothetical protein
MVPRTELQPTVVRRLTMPALNFWGTPQCDADGSVYVHAAANVNDPVVMKLKLADDDATMYRWERSEGWTGFSRFSVSPTGRVWFLGIDGNGGLFVVGFSSAGHETTRTNLEVPVHLEPEQFGALSDEAFLISGFFTKSAEEGNRAKRLSAIYDGSGKLLQSLKPEETTVDLGKIGHALPIGAAITGPDRNFYLLQSKRVVVFSPTGEVVRKVPTDKPVPEAIASHLWLSRDLQLAISFDVPDKEHPEILYPEFLVLDSVTGVARGYYKLPRSFRGTAVCFNGTEFSLIDRESERMVLYKAELR